MLIPILFLYSSEPQLRYILNPQSIEIDYRMPAEVFDPLFSSLARGEIAEITYDFRLFNKSRGILSLLGDKMLADRSIVYRIRYDELNSGYILSSGDDELFFPGFEELREKIRCAQITLTRPDSSETDNLYIRLRAAIIPRKLVAPFTILEPFLGSRHIKKEWKEYRYLDASGDN